MFKQLKMKIATRRLERVAPKKTTARKTRANHRKPSHMTIWSRICSWGVCSYNWLCEQFRRIWQWIRTRDVIGMINLTLLIAIIVLFAILIMSITRCNRTPRVYIEGNPDITVQSAKTRHILPRKQTTKTLPVARDVQTKDYVYAPVQTRPVKKCPALTRQLAKSNNIMHGDIVIDGHISAHQLQTTNEIRGNLYLQNMRKYTLPCGIVIKGNLFLRDINKLQFCGAFTVTGNIYVSPRSSFGPIPRTARLGGQVVL